MRKCLGGSQITPSYSIVILHTPLYSEEPIRFTSVVMIRQKALDSLGFIHMTVIRHRLGGHTEHLYNRFSLDAFRSEEHNMNLSISSLVVADLKFLTFLLTEGNHRMMLHFWGGLQIFVIPSLLSP